MITKKIKISILASIVCIATFAFANNLKGSIPEEASPKTVTISKTKSFTFPAGKIIEVALFSIKKGQENKVNQDYFSKIMPVAGEYGLSGAQTFTVIESHFGTKSAQQVGFFIWDSYEQKEKFNKDPRYLELRNIRNEAFDFLYMGYFQVEEDVTYTFDSDSYYDFAAMWLDMNHAPKLQEYFQHVAPIAMGDEFGYAPIVKLNPSTECTHGKYTPSFISFAKWKAKDSFKKFCANKTYKKHVHLRDEAVPYKDVFVVKPNIQ